MIQVYIMLAVVGLGLLLPARRIIGENRILVLGTAVYIVVTNWLSYTKNLPGRPFMGIQGLAGGYIPLIMSIPFFLYLPWKKNWARIVESSKAILIFGVVIIVLASIIKIAPRQEFERQVESARTSSVVPSYGSGLKLEGGRTMGKGFETLFAYLGESTKLPHEKLYQFLVAWGLVLLSWQIYEVLKKPSKFGLKEYLGLVVLGLAIILGKVMFVDLLPLVIFFAHGKALFVEWVGSYEWIIVGILWASMLMINPIACLYLVAPLLLIYDPKKLIYASGVAMLINPLMIGGWM